MSWMMLWACGAGSGLPVATLTVGDQSVRAEIAATDQDRAKGLMNRDHLAAGTGMLFVYDEDRVREFWMKDTRIPLSIAFADREGKIVKITDMQPFDTTHTSSVYPARYALEVNQGWFAEVGIEKGDVISGIPPKRD